jgi:Collagenase and related proteases
MPIFTIPTDFKTSTVEQIAEKNKQWTMPIKEVYGSMNLSLFGSGRISSVLHEVDLNTVQKYVEVLDENDILFNYTLNFICASNLEFTDKGKKETAKLLRKLHSIGIRRFTVASPSMLQLLKEVLPDAKASVSVLSNVDSYARLAAFVSYGNVDRIILPEYMNRKIAQTEKLVKQGRMLGYEFGTIVNSACAIDCPYREFHHTFISHAVKGKNFKPRDYYGSKCALDRIEHPAEVLKSAWIRPEDLKHYADLGISVFKIAGREMRNADFLRVVDIYNQGSFDGNFWELSRCFSEAPKFEELDYAKLFTLQNKELGQFTSRFFASKSFCSTKDCETCNYCNSYSKLVQVNNYAKWKQTLESDISFHGLT